MKRQFVSVLVGLSIVGLVVAACAQTPPTSAPTQPPSKAAEPAKPAAAPTAPAAAPAPAKPAATAQPTAAPVAKVTFPEKGRPITIIIGYAAGGSQDAIARLMAPELEKILGTSIVVVNKPGSSEVASSTELVRSKPDGYTLGFQGQPLVAVTIADPQVKATYSRKDFAPIAVLEGHSSALAVRADSPFKSAKELVDASNAKPDSVKFGTTGLLSTGAYPGYALQQAGAKFAFVHFEGGAPAVTALLGGHTDVSSLNPNLIVDHIKNGTLRAIATTGDGPNQYLPDVKTLQQQGYNVVSMTYIGIVAPAGVPKEVMDILSNAVKTVMQSEAVKKKMVDTYNTPLYLDSTGYSKLWDQAEVDAKGIVAIVRGLKP